MFSESWHRKYVTRNLNKIYFEAGFDPITSLTLGLGLSKEETILIGGSEKVTYVFRV